MEDARTTEEACLSSNSVDEDRTATPSIGKPIDAPGYGLAEFDEDTAFEIGDPANA